MKRIFYLLSACFFICPTFAQHNAGYDEFDEYDELEYVVAPDTVYVHDTIRIYISTLDDVTRHFGMSYDAYVKRFLRYILPKDSARQFSSQNIYLNYFLPMLEDEPDFPAKRWVGGLFSLHISPDMNAASMNYNTMPLPDSLPGNNRNFDILVECRGDRNTDFFLQSPHLIDACLVQLFKRIHKTNTDAQTKGVTQIKGVNFYFPDYSFRKKRAMAQFAKSVALVTDSCRLETIRGLKVYFSFNRQGADEIKYLSCLADMTDSIFILNNYASAGKVFTPVTVVTSEDAANYSLFSKIIDQFYLADYDRHIFPHTHLLTFHDADIIALIHSDYPENDWEIYAMILALIILVSILVFILYRSIPALSFFLNKNRDYMIILIFILVFELFILLFYMIEAMSRSEVFNFSRENQYLLLFMPVLLVFVVHLVKALRGRDKLP